VISIELALRAMQSIRHQMALDAAGCSSLEKKTEFLFFLIKIEQPPRSFLFQFRILLSGLIFRDFVPLIFNSFQRTQNW
jgi:hypothetical protein